MFVVERVVVDALSAASAVPVGHILDIGRTGEISRRAPDAPPAHGTIFSFLRTRRMPPAEMLSRRLRIALAQAAIRL